MGVAALMCGYVGDKTSLELDVHTTEVRGELGGQCSIALPPPPEMGNRETFMPLLMSLADTCAGAGP